MNLLRIIDKDTKLFLRDDFAYDEETEIGLEVEPSQGMYRPKWSGEKWIEDMTTAEIEDLRSQLEPVEPSEKERIEVLEQALLEIVLGGVF